MPAAAKAIEKIKIKAVENNRSAENESRRKPAARKLTANNGVM